MNSELSSLGVTGGNCLHLSPNAKHSFYRGNYAGIIDHGLGALDDFDFFGRLGEEHQRAVPPVFQANQRLGRPHPARHVNVVAATVGHESFLRGAIFAALPQPTRRCSVQRPCPGAMTNGALSGLLRGTSDSGC